MKNMEWSPPKISILVLVVVFLVAGVMACGKSTSTTTSSATTTPPLTYQLTHSLEDAEYILNWDLIVSQYPEIGGYDRLQAFVHRGETVQITPGENFGLDENSPAAWASTRFVRTEWQGETFRSFGVWTMYFETDEELDEYIQSMQMSGFPFQEEGDFVTGVLEVKTPPMKSVQLILAGNHFCVVLMEFASSDELLFCGKEALTEFISMARSNITSLEITPLPPEIPERKLVEDTYEWHEVMTVRSDELTLPVRVPEEEFYNDLWFEERPLMQVFNFVIDKDWRFVMTATGEIDTKFEVYITVSSSGEVGLSYGSDQVFSLYSETVTITKEQPLEEGYAPPVNIEITVYFDLPISWVITIGGKE